MGEQNVVQNSDEATRQAFMRSLLEEVQALERMLDKGMIESGKRRIGAEQEMFIINRAQKPANKALEILDAIGDERFTLDAGDSFTLPRGQIHQSWNPGEKVTSVVWVITPPTY